MTPRAEEAPFSPWESTAHSAFRRSSEAGFNKGHKRWQAHVSLLGEGPHLIWLFLGLMSDMIGFFSYLNVMLWLVQDLFSNWTQTGTAVVSSAAGMVQVMVLSLRLRGERHVSSGKPRRESGRSP